MPTNEAGLPGGHDLGDEGNTPATDMPGEGNMGVGQDAQGPSQAATDEAEDEDANGDPENATGPGD